jgi:anti-sigma factor RsiW
MTVTQLFRADDPAHRATEELLPWYVNGTLEADERAELEAHLAQCLRCRRELDAQRALQAVLASEESDVAVGGALARAHARIDRLESGWRPGASGAWFLRGWRSTPPWVRVALLGQLVLVLVLAIAFIDERGAPQLYRTLGAPSGPVAGVVRLTVVLENAAEEEDLRADLAGIGMRIVSRRNGDYTLEVPAERGAEALRKLRASAVVRSVDLVPETAGAAR